jgi:hypothetical protein
MTLQEEISDLVDDGEKRGRMYSDLAKQSRDLYHATKLALSVADNLDIPGWHIERVPIPLFGVEMRLCEATEVGVKYHLSRDEAYDITIVVQRGLLHVEYPDAGEAGTFEMDAGRMWYLPANVARTTFSAEVPTTLFAILYGRPQDRGRTDAPKWPFVAEPLDSRKDH